MARQVRKWEVGRFYVRFFVNPGFTLPLIHFCRKHGLVFGSRAKEL